VSVLFIDLVSLWHLHGSKGNLSAFQVACNRSNNLNTALNWCIQKQLRASNTCKAGREKKRAETERERWGRRTHSWYDYSNEHEL